MSVNERHNLIGLSHLMKEEGSNPDINIDELEKNIINGELDIQAEEIDLVSQYKNDMQRLSKKFGVSLSADDAADKYSSAADNYSSAGIREATSSDYSIWESENTSDHAASSLKRETSFNLRSGGDKDAELRSNEYDGGDHYNKSNLEGLKLGDLNNYKFRSSNEKETDQYKNPYSNENPYSNGGHFDKSNDPSTDPYLQNMTQEQQKRSHLRQVFNSISSNDRVPMDNYDLMADREHEDKQMLLSEIEELRDDLNHISVDISRVKEVDNNSSMAEIREVHRKLIYKNNSNNYSTFADELFILGAQTAEYLFDGDKEWFGHKPDLTGWANTVRGKLRRMRYTKTRIVRKIVDDYKIPDWLQIGIEIVPSAFTHSRHRKSAVKDSVVNNATYQDAIHDLNNIVN